MTQHFTRNTVSAAHWCSKCQKSTQHRIDDRRVGPCLECIAKYDAEKNVIDFDELRRKLRVRSRSKKELFA